MSTLSIALGCLCLLFLIIACYSIYLNYKLGMTILGYQDALEDSLDLIDSKYSSISNILEKPIFFDSMEVRQVVSDIKDTRDSLVVIARKLTRDGNEETEEF
tara:strand:- start:31 stop:336 length:306 start_codon:yes stop_codon:yes gene_type:complete